MIGVIVKPTRKHNRLNGYNYNRNGAYFITICAINRKEIFGVIVPVVGAATCRPRVELSNIGKTVDTVISKIPYIYPYAVVDTYVIMPNHVHLTWKDDCFYQIKQSTTE